MTGPGPDTDVVALLLQDHAVIEELITGYEGLTDEQRRERFERLVHDLVRHEVAEERIVYPSVRIDLLPGDELAQALLRQEQQIERMLAAAEQLDPAAESFIEVLSGVQELVRDHLRSEEHDLLPLLRRLEAPDRRWQLGVRYLRAVRAAATHPHPHLPQSRAGTATLGRIAALADRVRDSIERQSG